MLEVRDLRVALAGRTIVSIDELALQRGETLGLIGESGSGKSMTTLAITGLAQTIGAHVAGSIRFEGVELIGLSPRRLRAVRGARIGSILQTPSACFNPVFRLRDVFLRALRQHGCDRTQARQRARDALERVFLSPDVLDRYPHQVSGGQAQRVAIALAIALGCELLLADEPTSALDATVQREVLQLLADVRVDTGMALLFISHDLAVVAQLCDRVAVMAEGRIVESGFTLDVLDAPEHPLTRQLIDALPALPGPELARGA
jgi:ABC-type glutathione transport system ATPase component